jgi:hypothetical protein
MSFLDVVKLVGGLAGLIALLWRAADEIRSYLRISVEVSAPHEGWATVLTTVDNKGLRPKSISWAFLIIGPEEEDPIKTAKTLLAGLKIMHSSIKFTNDLFSLKRVVKSPISLEHRALVPLPFYFEENVDISDETLAYRAPISVNEFPALTPFSVRFFIGDDRRLHRSTHDCFVITSTDKAGTPPA